MNASKKRSLVLATALGLAAMLGASDASAFRNTLLQTMMKRLNGFVAAGSTEQAVAILNVVKAMGPDEYGRWADMAEKARAAAAAGNATGLKAACTGCHTQYRESYKAKYGSGAPDGKGPVPVER